MVNFIKSVLWSNTTVFDHQKVSHTSGLVPEVQNIWQINKDNHYSYVTLKP